MALGTYRVSDIARQKLMAGTYGNLAVKGATILLAATVAQNETCDFMELPVGTRIVDSLIRMTAAAAGTVTFQLGIAQKPAHLDTKVDADGILLAAAISTSARIARRNNAAVGAAALTLDDTYIIQGLIGAAALGATPVTVDVEVFYEYLGAA